MALFRKGSRLFSVFYVTACRYLLFNDLNHLFADGFSGNRAETAAKLPARRRRGPSAGPGPDSCIYNLDTCGPGEKGAKRAAASKAGRSGPFSDSEVPPFSRTEGQGAAWPEYANLLAGQ